jgi:hypothetical protein
VAKIISLAIMNLITPKAEAEPEHLFNKLASTFKHLQPEANGIKLYGCNLQIFVISLSQAGLPTHFYCLRVLQLGKLGPHKQ